MKRPLQRATREEKTAAARQWTPQGPLYLAVKDPDVLERVHRAIRGHRFFSRRCQMVDSKGRSYMSPYPYKHVYCAPETARGLLQGGHLAGRELEDTHDFFFVEHYMPGQEGFIALAAIPKED